MRYAIVVKCGEERALLAQKRRGRAHERSATARAGPRRRAPCPMFLCAPAGMRPRRSLRSPGQDDMSYMPPAKSWNAGHRPGEERAGLSAGTVAGAAVNK